MLKDRPNDLEDITEESSSSMRGESEPGGGREVGSGQAGFVGAPWGPSGLVPHPSELAQSQTALRESAFPLPVMRRVIQILLMNFVKQFDQIILQNLLRSVFFCFSLLTC